MIDTQLQRSNRTNEKKKASKTDQFLKYGAIASVGTAAVLTAKNLLTPAKPKPTIMQSMANGLKNIFGGAKGSPIFTLAAMLGLGATYKYYSNSMSTPIQQMPANIVPPQSITSKLTQLISKPLQWIRGR